MIDSEFGISDFDDDFAISDNRTFAPNTPHTRQVWSCISKHNDWVQAGKHASITSGMKNTDSSLRRHRTSELDFDIENARDYS